MGISDNLKRGVTELVLLGLLSEQDMYGYEMAQALRERSRGKFVLQETSMYPTLYRLQDGGYISAREELVGKQVCFIANLAPRKLKGIVSEGMILSAENFDGSLAVIMPQKEVKPGSEVK